MSFCPICSKCPTCCHRDQCWGKASELLAGLAKVRIDQSGFNFERRLHSSFHGKATSLPFSLDSKQICQPNQKQVAFRSTVLPHTKASSGKGGCQVFSGLLEPSLSGSKTQQEMATNIGPEQTQYFPRNRDVQNVDPGDHKTVPPKRGMGHLTGFQRCVLPHSYSSKIQKVSKVSSEQAQLPVHLSPLWFGNGPVHQSGQGSKTDGSSQGYKDPPVPRRLVVESLVPGNLPTTYPNPLGPLP